MADSEFREAYSALVRDVKTAISMENALTGRCPELCGKKRSRDAAEEPRPCREVAARVLDACRAERARRSELYLEDDISDAALSRGARFTDKFSLKSYERFLHYVPRLVNVVTVLPSQPAHSPPSPVRLPQSAPFVLARSSPRPFLHRGPE